MVKTIQEIIDYPYKRDDDNFVKDCLEYFTELNYKDGKLSDNDVDKFMKKITKGGKTKSILSHYKNDVDEKINIIYLLAKNHQCLSQDFFQKHHLYMHHNRYIRL